MDYKLLIFILISSTCLAQNNINGIVTQADSGIPVSDVAIYKKSGGLLATTDINGFFEIVTSADSLRLVFFSYDYEVRELDVNTTTVQRLNVTLQPLSQELTAIEITARKKRIFQIKRLKDIEGTAIYAGKKTEVILLENSNANLAANNARQIFNQVAGLNIFQNDDAGLQLNIGGRGLNPNRTSNFNTRQNGYDISADVLGYPESYYSPASEAVEEIQIVRGAASLQYGTQLGGLVNFKLKSPVKDKKLELITRNTLGSYNLYTNFTSASGTIKKWSYYTFFNYKSGDGFRPNSGFNSRNIFAQIGYQATENTKITGEITYLDYLSQQAGGLTDRTFREDPYQSNRARNWFDVNWLLYNVNLEHAFNNRTNFSLNIFGLDAQRNALGFRENRADQVDPGDTPRDLIKGSFNNYGAEARLLTQYNLGSKDAAWLIGAKFYKADNSSTQGPGSDGSDANFSFQRDEFPNYPFQNDFNFPNLNVSLFSENILYVSDTWSVTPGARFEYIKTESDGVFTTISTDGAGNVIFRGESPDQAINERSFILLGLGSSYKITPAVELYVNASQNYRSVTFTDISTVNPAFAIYPDIDDERGVSTDLGLRGNYKEVVSYDVNVFGLFYNDRIGFTQAQQDDGSVKTQRGNVGDAFIYGLESLVEIDFNEAFIKREDIAASIFFNTSILQSEYTTTDTAGIEGNEVEFVPEINFKTGIKLGYKDFKLGLQYSYLSQQFTDATNSIDGSLSGVIGEIPAYGILDLSTSYTYDRFRLEAGINNLLDNAYFTRRATGYPGPGIIPSAPINFYATLQIKI